MSKADQTRQTIVELSSQVFNTKGYAGTSFSDIIHATGLSKGCIYGHFENKDAIAVAAFDYNHQAVTELMKSKIVATDYSIDRLLVYPAIYRDFERERGKTLELLSSLLPDDLTKTSMHPRLSQPMRVVDLMYFVAEHDQHHFDTIARIIDITGGK